MQEINVRNWEGFETRLSKIRQTEAGKTAEFLFRGLGNSAWPLKTTLERAGQERMPVREYFRLTYAVRPAVEAFTSAKWNLPDLPDLVAPLRDYDSLRFS